MLKTGRGVRKVVIPVAGLGTRGLPFTKEVPKELIPVIDTPVIQFILEEVVEAGIEQVILVTNRDKVQVENYFDRSPHLESWLRKRGKEEEARRLHEISQLCEVITVRQNEPLGLGHAVLRSESVVGQEPFALCLGDEIFPTWDGSRPALSRLVETWDQVGVSLLGAMEIRPDETEFHGVLDLGGEEPASFPARVFGTVEKPRPEVAPSRFGIVGRYVFEPEVFDFLREAKPGLGGEIQLTDALDRLSKTGRLYALKLEGPHYDMGHRLSFVKAQVDAALHRPDLAPKLREYLGGLIS